MNQIGKDFLSRLCHASFMGVGEQKIITINSNSELVLKRFHIEIKIVKLSVTKKYRRKSSKRRNLFTSSIWKINLKQKDNKSRLLFSFLGQAWFKVLPKIFSALKKGHQVVFKIKKTCICQNQFNTSPNEILFWVGQKAWAKAYYRKKESKVKLK